MLHVATQMPARHVADRAGQTEVGVSGIHRDVQLDVRNQLVAGVETVLVIPARIPAGAHRTVVALLVLQLCTTDIQTEVRATMLYVLTDVTTMRRVVHTSVTRCLVATVEMEPVIPARLVAGVL